MIDTLETYLQNVAKRKTGRLTLATLGAMQLLKKEENFGRKKYFGHPSTGCMCTLGAVMRADLAAQGVKDRTHSFDIEDIAVKAARQAGLYKVNGETVRIAEFNDTQPFEVVYQELCRLHRYAKKHGL
ncbi:hypothetical protein Ql52_gp008 [Caulobacter phage Quill_5.2]|uniref:Uncharacterized protein n=1 Tax=Caulobacter phage Quill_5.2 TaxID=3075108 RepID=A0AA96PRG5_9CAUD|nr:hypothetical protein Ql52_gp008 [Caulobacter phage Quill_5.2]